MIDSSWIRSYNNKAVAIVTNTGTNLQLQGSQTRLIHASDTNGAQIVEYWDGTNFNFYGSALAANVLSIYTGSGFGRVGIRKDGPAYALEVGLDSAGKPGTSTWTVVSDERTKKAVRAFEHGLDDLKKLPQLISFKYNGAFDTPEDDMEFVGYKAQEVLPIAPKMVRRTEVGNEEVLALNLDVLTHMHTNAILELAARVEKLEKRK